MWPGWRAGLFRWWTRPGRWRGRRRPGTWQWFGHHRVDNRKPCARTLDLGDDGDRLCRARLYGLARVANGPDRERVSLNAGFNGRDAEACGLREAQLYRLGGRGESRRQL